MRQFWDENMQNRPLCSIKPFNTSFESSDLCFFLETEAKGSGSSFILCHALLKIDILYENRAYSLCPKLWSIAQ